MSLPLTVKTNVRTNVQRRAHTLQIVAMLHVGIYYPCEMSDDVVLICHTELNRVAMQSLDLK